jgi:trehalose 6-phosphate phosphatase
MPGLLAPFVDRPSEAGVFTDYDGTLAPIVEDPERAEPLPGAVDALARLARRYARAGVISGRPGAWLAARLGARGLFLSGLYGLETVEDGTVVALEEAAAWAPVVEEVAARAESPEGPGVDVERKGLAVTLHFRTRPGLAVEALTWAEAEAGRTGLALLAGRHSYELRPPVARNKGTVLREAAAGLAAVCFAGDDRGDLEAFDALDELAGAGVAALRVGVRSPEMPPELGERADLVVDGPAGVLDLFEQLLR